MDTTTQDSYDLRDSKSVNRIPTQALSKLPPEIVELIIYALCQSCQYCDHGYEPTVAGRGTLENLSLTCKRFRYFAAPHLRHTFSLYHKGPLDPTNHGFVIHQRTNRLVNRGGSLADIRYVEANLSLQCTWGHSGQRRCACRKDLHSSIPRTLASLSNLEKLDIIVDGSCWYKEDKIIMPQFQGWEVYNSVKSLRFLCARPPDGQEVSAYHTLAWGGSQLIDKLPNLTSLYIHGITRLKFYSDPMLCHGYPTLAHLRYLKLTNCRYISRTCFSLLVEHCRLLEVFIFGRGESPDGGIIREWSWNNYNLESEISPREIVDELSRKIPKTLKRLTVGPWFGWEGQYAPANVYYRNRYEFMQDKLVRRNVIGSLRRFRNLEEVHLCQDVIIGPPKCTVPDENGDPSLDMLPVSLKKLKISGANRYLTPCLMRLLEATCRGKLREICLSSTNPFLDQLDTFEEKQSLMSEWPRIDEKDLDFLTQGFKEKGVNLHTN
ncbi:hypothetical protein CSIM01_02158 [Colletotrichum simmondsii]|uniref:Uncharacterized protein n=1 Tax=Colletotrichum simmondsii TaxID=703756 RepID=A0A135RZM9_9PEZI|nr:hypothetical protein CSIM01_02158 [Colletotrichum simmondsii]